MEDFVDIDITVTEFIHATHRERDCTWCYESKERLSCGLVYFYSGTVEYTDSNTTIPGQANSVYWLEKGQSYTFRATGEENIGFIHLSFLTAGTGLPFRVLQIPEDHPDILSQFHEAVELASQKGVAYNIAVKSKISWLLFELLRLYVDVPDPQTGSCGDLWESIAHIHRHLGDKISLEELSAISGYSPSHYRKRFQAAFGMPPVRYINLKRVEKAKKLLLSGLYTKRAIAEICGFESQQFFTRVFKKFTGKTPSEFAKM